MRKIRIAVAVIVAKLIKLILNLSGRGGTNVPGNIASKICPKIMGTIADGMTVILVTGTNGKTTMTRMIGNCLDKAGIGYICNRAGANMYSGIATEFVTNAKISGKCRYSYALIECDEMSFIHVSREVKINFVVVSNVFRDQLDRYGEVTTTLKCIRNGILEVPDAVVCLNADCSLLCTMRDDISNKIIYFGVDCPIYAESSGDVSDEIYCQKCGVKFEYDYTTYAHLGGFHCPGCGFSRPETEVSAKSIIECGADESRIELRIGDNVYEAVIGNPGGFNIYNGVAAACVTHAAGLSDNDILSALASRESGFGRMEKIDIGSTSARMILTKNPIGANQVIRYVAGQNTPVTMVFALNDKYADGTDVSWIWDANFDDLQRMGDRLVSAVACGDRCNDMALRLYYAGVERDKIKIIENNDLVADYIASQTVPVYIMPTYTALFSIRKALGKHANIKNFWKK